MHRCGQFRSGVATRRPAARGQSRHDWPMRARAQMDGRALGNGWWSSRHRACCCSAEATSSRGHRQARRAPNSALRRSEAPDGRRFRTRWVALSGRGVRMVTVPSGPTAAVAVVLAFNEAINPRGRAALSGLMADTHRFTDSAGATVDGKSACLDAWRWQGFFDAFLDYRNAFGEAASAGTAHLTAHLAHVPGQRSSTERPIRARTAGGDVPNSRASRSTHLAEVPVEGGGQHKVGCPTAGGARCRM